jgi:hypothetical protein
MDRGHGQGTWAGDMVHDAAPPLSSGPTTTGTRQPPSPGRVAHGFRRTHGMSPIRVQCVHIPCPGVDWGSSTRSSHTAKGTKRLEWTLQDDPASVVATVGWQVQGEEFRVGLCKPHPLFHPLENGPGNGMQDSCFDSFCALFECNRNTAQTAGIRDGIYQESKWRLRRRYPVGTRTY